ncbi:DUF2958 domain-containing protein [Mesorhizobium loti]|uniref:DUF2958 domain-containing protein n=1 Tax=Rhizobium loti TaxID=381 RepID=UPI003D2ED7F1
MAASIRLRGTRDEIDFVPVVKLFTPDAGATWLLTEIDRGSRRLRPLRSGARVPRARQRQPR